MRRSLTPTFRTALILVALFPLGPALTDQQESEESKDPCDDLLVVVDGGENSENEDTAQSLDLSIKKLDECLETLLYGNSTSGNGAGTNSIENSALDSLDSGEMAATQTGDSGDLASSLVELDRHLDGQEIELTSMDQKSTQQPNSGKEASPANDPSQLATHLDNSEQSSDIEVSSQGASDNDGNSVLKGGEPTQEGRHAEPNRQPADPEDEDQLLKQLREAAEKESNPRTKKALWDQYYEYLDNRKKR